MLNSWSDCGATAPRNPALVLCGLTLELSRDRRHCAWAARRNMYPGASRPKRNAVGRRLERLVRPRFLGTTDRMHGLWRNSGLGYDR
jgi:hypothetical protein